MQPFELVADYKPMGDQPEAIKALVDSFRAGNQYQTLLGVTGSGKTFTAANIIKELQRPTLVISHNKTLAAQLYSEFKSFFPNNAVEYFVSYYDYYQPEAYVPQTDTYIEKDSSINDEIERLRISASSSLISRRDVIVVASVSCIYGLGSPDDFEEMMIPLQVGEEIRRDDLLGKLVEILYDRNDIDFKRGSFRVRGEVVDVFPAYMESAIRIEFWGDEIESIRDLDPLTGELGEIHKQFNLYPANQFITPRHKVDHAIQLVREEMESQVAYFEKEKLYIEAQRIRMRTEYDIEMLQEIGFCSGIENYSRHMSGRSAGQRPWCLIDFFPKDFLLFVDESHVTMPQFGAMYLGDRSRKEKLVRYGFRLPSALDNRPLMPDEFEEVTGQTLLISATPSVKNIEKSKVVAEQIIRPTGLLDPIMEMHSSEGQVEHLIGEIHKAVDEKERVLVTTLTKRMSEDLTVFLREAGIKVEYLHSDIDVIERVEILKNLRGGKFDVLIGVNLLREGLDLPEVALVAILDADKEGFLRNTTSLIQTAGRASRHEKGRVILYANQLNRSLSATIEITEDRRARQIAYNEAHGITPTGVKRGDQKSLQQKEEEETSLAVAELGTEGEVAKIIAELENEMVEASNALEFERAAILRDQIETLKKGGKFDLKAKDKPQRRYRKYKRRRS